MRVFLGTNVLASAIATRGICADVLHTALAEHDVVVSEQVLEELGRTLLEKFRVSRTLVRDTEEFLRRQTEVVGDAPSLGIPIRDEDDAKILDHAVAGAADVLVTGDRDLVELDDRPPLPILTPRGFWDLLRSESG